MRRPKRNKIIMLLGGASVLTVLFGLFISISSTNTTYYHNPNEVLENPDQFSSKNIRVMGLVQSGSVKWNANELSLQFQITEDGKRFVSVDYRGIKPDMFRQGQGVVAEGRFENGVFMSDRLLVKHSEEYKTKEHALAKEKYLQSLQSSS